MVGLRTFGLMCLCAAMASPGALAQAENAGGGQRPVVVNPGDAMARPLRRADLLQQAQEAARSVFETGLIGGFAGTYEFRRAIDYTEQMGEDETTAERMSENHTLVVTLSSGQVRPDGLTIVVGTFERVASRIETSDGPVSLDFDLMAPLPEDADNLSGLDAMLPILKKAQFRLLVDINGNVTDVENLPSLEDLGSEAGSLPPGIMRILDREEFGVLMGKVFNAEGGVERTRDANPVEIPTWTTIEEVELGPSGTLTITRSWSPRVGKTEQLEATGQYGIVVEALPTPNDAAPRCEIAGYTGKGRLLWGEDGGLVYLNSNEELGMRWILGAEELRSTQTSTTIIQRIEE